MKRQKVPDRVQRTIVPQRVWKTLTAAQRKAVLRTVVSICHHLASQWDQEARHEPTTER